MDSRMASFMGSLRRYRLPTCSRDSVSSALSTSSRCCGFAGDKGFTHPEVNAYALRKLRPQLEKAGIEVGYSNSRTCEIGLTTNSDIPYLSIVYLVDQCTKQKGGNS